jgi:hypothetical protein
MKKRLVAIAMAGGIALAGSAVGTLVLPGSSAHGASLDRCHKLIAQDDQLDALQAKTPNQQTAYDAADAALDAQIHSCYQKVYG